MKDKPLKIIQISDVHLGKDKGSMLLGVNTYESFTAVVKLVQQEQPQIDAVFLSGDLSQDASPSAYENLADTLQMLQAPAYAIPGNHDNPKVMARVYPRHRVNFEKQVVLGNWQIIFLDSHKPNAVEGYLETQQLAHLQQCLKSRPTQHALLMLHHHPVPVGSAWLDKLGLSNASALWELLAYYPQIKVILFGHIHQELEVMKQNIQCLATPSTCIQFTPQQDEFGLIEQTPGYRWLELYADGRVETGVRRLDHYVGSFDKNARGY